MEIHTEKNLTNLCRICFGEGEYNLLEFKVKLPTCVNELCEQPTMDEKILNKMIGEELTAQEMLKAFGQNQVPEFIGSNAFQLICHSCLNELIPSFIFMQKVKFANEKIVKLSSVDDFKMETDLEVEQPIEYLEDHEEEYLDENLKSNNETEECKIKIDETTFGEIYLKEEHIDIDNENTTTMTFEVEPAAPATTIGQKRKVTAKNPTIVLTGGVTQMLSHINRANQTTKSTRSSVAITKPSPQKRIKTQRDKQIQQAQHRPLEPGSFVITQFIPSTTQIQLETIPSNEDHLKDGFTEDYTAPCNELRTMDYAAVEIQCSSDLQVNEMDNYVSSVNNNQNDTTKEATDSSGGVDPTSSQPIYVCKYCPQAFSASHFLITHARKCHVCKFCTEAFCKTTDLYEHIRSNHTEHRCVICGKELSTHSNLRSHIKRVHGVKLPAQVALLDYRRQTGVLSETQELFEEKNDFEANSIESIDAATDCDKIVQNVDQLQNNIDYEDNIHYIEQEIVNTDNITEKRKILNYVS